MFWEEIPDQPVLVCVQDYNRLLPRLKEQFDVIVIPGHGWNGYNRMHDKFCIVDLEYVMHGSYNWTLTTVFVN